MNPITRAKEFYQKYERWMPIAFFALGFVFDALMLRRIDELKAILQQALYIILSAYFIGQELLGRKGWKYREPLLHFMLGTLLNSYTIFYFKSASSLTSFIFIALLIGLLIVNEFKRFGESQTKVHVAFWSLSLTSYLISLVPILVGFIGTIPFLLAIAASILIFVGACRLLLKKFQVSRELLKSHLVVPFAAIQVIFTVFYVAKVIPPVPLSVQYMGIYHDIKKEHGEYQLIFTRSRWKFWQHGDQTFSARPGDSIYCFARIFSPSRFKDKLQIRWLYHDERHGWMPADAIPLQIEGGREEGYRSVTQKKNYQPGEWKVQVETMDNREVGHIRFAVEADTDATPRDLKTENQ